MVVTDSDGETVYIPMLLSEKCVSGSLPEIPFIKMHRGLTRYIPHNIEGSVRFMESWVDLKVYFNNVDAVDITDFKQQILNALQDAVRTNQVGVTGTFWMNIEDERDIEEFDGKQVTFIYVITLYCQHHDAC